MHQPVMLPMPEHHWECPSCGRQQVTRTYAATSQLHHCPAQAGMIVPFVEVANNHGLSKGHVRHQLIERGDYEGTEHGITHDANGRAIMAVHTERADGSHDTHVFAPTAHAKIGA